MSMLILGNWKVHVNLNFFHYILPSTKPSGYKIGIKFSNTPLVVEPNNSATKIVNAYIIDDLDDWSRNPLNKFILTNCLRGVTNIVKNAGKRKYVC